MFLFITLKRRRGTTSFPFGGKIYFRRIPPRICRKLLHHAIGTISAVTLVIGTKRAEYTLLSIASLKCTHCTIFLY